MKKGRITEAKNRLSALIDSIKGGSPVLIVDWGASEVGCAIHSLAAAFVDGDLGRVEDGRGG